MSLFDKIKGKYNDAIVPLLAKYRKSKINNSDFSIICNNCWGGYVYRHFGLSYLSPTIGLYFFSSDYIKFIYNLRYYLEKCDLTFISYEESKYKEVIKQRGQINVPIARLDDIEIVFLHYATQEEAEEKWKRRTKRVNYDNLIFKTSATNLFTDDEMKAFDAFKAKKKIAFVSEQYRDYNSAIVIENVDNDTRWYETYIDLIKLINSKSCEGRIMHGKYK